MQCFRYPNIHILHHPTTSLIPLQRSQNSEDQRRAHFHDDQGPFFGALWSLQSLQSLRVWRLGNDMKPSPTNIWSGVKHCTLHAIYPPVRVEHLAEILGMTRSIKNSWNGAFLIAKYCENVWEFPSLCPTIRAAASRKSCTIATLREPPTSQATAMDRARSTKSSYWTVTHGAVNAGQKHQGSHQNRSLQPLLAAKSNMWNASNQWKLVPKLQWAAIVGV